MDNGREQERQPEFPILEDRAVDGSDSEVDSNRVEAQLLAVGQVAVMMSCSERSVWRLSDAGKMPAPVRIGRLVRWPRNKLQQWIDDGCPVVRTLRKAG
jgi:excisionase family DNA binding protein